MLIRHLSAVFQAGGIFLLLSCLYATANSSSPQLPAEVAMNPMAGRGEYLIVSLRTENGEKLRFVLDTGTSGTLIDRSLASRLGKPVGKVRYQSWGVVSTYKEYAAPRLYLGDTPLIMTNRIATYDCKNDFAGENPPVVGILGMDVLGHYCVQLDFSAGKVRLLDDKHADRGQWGEAIPIVPVSSRDQRPAVAYNLLGLQAPHSLIDSGCTYDGWLMPQNFEQWTNQAVAPAEGEGRSPNAFFDGEKYPLADLERQNVTDADGIGLHFLARHLVTLDFPNHTLYLKRQSIGPLQDPEQKTAAMKDLQPLIDAMTLEDTNAAREALGRIEQGSATDFEKMVARTLEATLENAPRPASADVPLSVTELALGDCRPELAEVGWLQPAANRIPLNTEIEAPFLDSGKIYATGLFAHSPSRYVFDLDGKWQRLRGEAGLHTAFQNGAYGVVFVIKADGKEVFRSAAVRGAEHPRYDVDVTGVKRLELVVEKAHERNGGNWGLWLDPTLFRAGT